MAQTWGDLKAEVLTLSESTGATDIAAVAALALHKSLKYVSRLVRLRRLISSATYAWTESLTDGVAIGGGGFGITNYETPHLLLVGDMADADTKPVPYTYVEYSEWLVLRSVPSSGRLNLDAVTLDARPDRAYTIDLNSKIIIEPIVEDDVNFFYFKAPAAYSDAGYPEIEDVWTDLLVDMGLAVTKFFIENPGAPIPFFEIFQRFDQAIKLFSQSLTGPGYRRPGVKVHHTYSPKMKRTRL